MKVEFTAPILGLVAGLGLLAMISIPRSAESHVAANAVRTVLAPTRALGSVTGTVVDRHGDPVPGARVAVLAEDGSVVAESRASASSESALSLGEFRIDQLPRGTYTVRVTLASSGSDARVARIPVTPWEDTRVRVRLDLGY